MATNFSANQYENAFVSNRIQNWEVPSKFRERPRPIKGTPKAIANDQGHLLPEYRRSNTGILSDFVGTWDLPKKIPGNRIRVPTARSKDAFDQLQDAEHAATVKTRRQPKAASFRSVVNEPGSEAEADKAQEPCCCTKHCGSRTAAGQNSDGQGDFTERSQYITGGYSSDRILAL